VDAPALAVDRPAAVRAVRLRRPWLEWGHRLGLRQRPCRGSSWRRSRIFPTVDHRNSPVDRRGRCPL